MKKYKMTIIIAFIAALLIMDAGNAHAHETTNRKSKFEEFISSPKQRDNIDFNPYIENFDHTHQPMKNLSPFHYGDDLNMRDLIKHYQALDLLRSIGAEEETGLLTAVVGPNFYDLSGSDQRHFIATLDQIYNVTNGAQGVLFLKDWLTDRLIGQYSQYGLMLF